MDVCLLWVLCLVSYRSLRGLITRTEESYRVWCVLSVIMKPRYCRGPDPLGAVAQLEKNFNITFWINLSESLCLLTVSDNALSNTRLKWWKPFTDILYSTRISRLEIFCQRNGSKKGLLWSYCPEKQQTRQLRTAVMFLCMYSVDLKWTLPFSANTVGILTAACLYIDWSLFTCLVVPCQL
jgi:hypothetical protein